MKTYLVLGLLTWSGLASANDPPGTVFQDRSRTVKSGVVVYRSTVRNADGSLRASVTQTWVGDNYYKNTKLRQPDGSWVASRAAAPSSGQLTTQVRVSSPTSSRVTETHYTGPTDPGTVTALRAFDSARLGRSLTR